MRSHILLVTSVLSLLGLAACPSKSSAREPWRPQTPEEWCRGRSCVRPPPRVPGDPPIVLLGTDVDVFSIEGCGVTLAWPIDAAMSARFQATMYTNEYEILPFAEGLATLHCWPPTPEPGGTRPPVAEIDTSPKSSAPRLSPGHVFIPLKGEATLGGDSIAAAQVEQVGPIEGPLSVTIGVSMPRRKGRSFHGLREGDPFEWGPYPAKVVRIVIWADRVVGALVDGWVEVALGPRAQEGSQSTVSRPER